MLVDLENQKEEMKSPYTSILKGLVHQSQSAIHHFFENIDEVQLLEAFEECYKTQGLILLTGVGKSGVIAEKIAATLISTGTKALFVPAGNFLHGDIGILSSNDLVIMISKSGETEELLDLIPFAKKRGARLLAVVSRKGSKLERGADSVVYLPVQRELGPLDLIPTVSTTVQLIFGDILAIFLMKVKQFSMEDFADNHPAGAIGKRLLLKVSDLMFANEKIPLCPPDAKIVDLLVELSEKKCGCMIVADENKKLLGIFTDGDLRRCLQHYGPHALEMKVEEVMTYSPTCVTKEGLAWEAMKKMQQDPKKWIMVAPVLEGEIVVGILRMHDIIQAGI